VKVVLRPLTIEMVRKAGLTMSSGEDVVVKFNYENGDFCPADLDTDCDDCKLIDLFSHRYKITLMTTDWIPSSTLCWLRPRPPIQKELIGVPRRKINQLRGND